MSRKRVLERCAALGVEVDITASSVDACSPVGHVFAATGSHALVASKWDDDTMSDVYRMALADLADGLMPCIDAACEYCREGRHLST